MKTILGVSALYHDAAAAVVRGGEIVAAAQEERFSRRKHDRSFPHAAIAYCLSEIGGADRLDAVAFYENPVLAFDRVMKNAIDLAPQTEAIWPAAVLSQLGEKLDVLERIAQATGGRESSKQPRKLFVVDHHMSHAASAFYPSPFAAAAIVVADGVGEWATTTIAEGDGLDIRPLAVIRYPHSLGLFYSAITYHCGFKVNSGEHKLMGLSPYGRPRFVRKMLDELIDLKEDGSFRLNTGYFGFLASEAATNARFSELVGAPPRQPDAALAEIYLDLAASAQAVIDEAMFRTCRHALAVTGRDKLCLAGGVALNCVSNARLAQRLPDLEDIWIQPAPGDAGAALGAALYTAHRHDKAARHAGVGSRDGQRASLLGPGFSRGEVEQALKQAGISAEYVEDEEAYVERVADALARGLIVGRFHGRMEFGPRALGNRSILADARLASGQRRVNERIKYRESWRPFGPSVLAERAQDYFVMSHESPYMLSVGEVRLELREPVDWDAFRAGRADIFDFANAGRSSLPAVTHVDYSARVQTVDEWRNPPFHKLLTRFYEISGSPVLINTSFNVRGEPMVCTPHDAIACFVNTGIDLLAIEGFLAFKQDQSAEVKARQGSSVYEAD